MIIYFFYLKILVHANYFSCQVLIAGTLFEIDYLFEID